MMKRNSQSCFAVLCCIQHISNPHSCQVPLSFTIKIQIKKTSIKMINDARFINVQLAAISQALLALSHHVSMIFLNVFTSRSDDVRIGFAHNYPFLSFVQPVWFSIANLNRKHNRNKAFIFWKMPKEQKKSGQRFAIRIPVYSLFWFSNTDTFSPHRRNKDQHHFI